MQFTTSTGQTYFLHRANELEGRYFWSTEQDEGKLSELPAEYGLREAPNAMPVVLPKQFLGDPWQLNDKTLREIAQIQLPGFNWVLPLMAVDSQLPGKDEFVPLGFEVNIDHEKGTVTIVEMAVCTTHTGTHYYLYQTGEDYYWSTDLDTTTVLRQFPSGYTAVEGTKGQPLLVPAHKASDPATLDFLASKQILGHAWCLPKMD